jgi:hypothetical protein
MLRLEGVRRLAECVGVPIPRVFLEKRLQAFENKAQTGVKRGKERHKRPQAVENEWDRLESRKIKASLKGRDVTVGLIPINTAHDSTDPMFCQW